MLSALEQRLGAQEAAIPRWCSISCADSGSLAGDLIEQFVADLARQLEDRERRAHFTDHNRRLFSKRQSVESQLRSAETQAAEAGAQLAGLQSERAAAHAVLAFLQTAKSGSADRVSAFVGRHGGRGAHRGARRIRSPREGRRAGVPGAVPGCAARDQSCSDRLFRNLVPASGEDAARESRARGHFAS